MVPPPRNRHAYKIGEISKKESHFSGHFIEDVLVDSVIYFPMGREAPERSAAPKFLCMGPNLINGRTAG